jgi:2-polyprenyl-3-methyl-5-hydroxy-6-metoxy-1,4-benzoquinol methylase
MPEQISPYRGLPLETLLINGELIPCFSKMDDYIRNYEQISSCHVNHMQKTGRNPFMDEAFWLASEEQTRKLISEFSKSGEKILDVGIGLGRLLEWFPDLDRYGMDISTSYLPIAKKKGINVCLSKIEDMPYKRDFFDVVVCTDVLEHVFDLYLAVKSLVEVLKPGGHLIVRVPYKEDLSFYLSAQNPYEFVHVRSFDDSSVQLELSVIHKLRMVKIRKGPYLQPFLNPKIRGLGENYRRFVRLFSYMAQIFGQRSYHASLRFLYDPYEINVVLQKGDANPDSRGTAP